MPESKIIGEFVIPANKRVKLESSNGELLVVLEKPNTWKILVIDLGDIKNA